MNAARTILVLVGLPASGKSTHARELLRAEPDRWIRVCRDDLRAMIVLPEHAHTSRPARERLLRLLKIEITRAALAQGFDVILDDTHLFPGAIERVHELAELIGDVNVIEKCFPVSLDECLARNARRPSRERVPMRVLVRMALQTEQCGLPVADRETYYAGLAPLASSEVAGVEETEPQPTAAPTEPPEDP